MIKKADLKVATIASKDMSRQVIAAVRITFDGTDTITMVATDGYKLFERTVQVDYEPDFTELLIPATKLTDVAKLMKASDYVEFNTKEITIYDKVGEVRYVIDTPPVTEGKYPDYHALVSSKSQYITLNAVYLKELLDACTGSDTSIIQLQVPIDAGGQIMKRNAVRIDTTTSNGTAMAILMPLKD